MRALLAVVKRLPEHSVAERKELQATLTALLRRAVRAEPPAPREPFAAAKPPSSSPEQARLSSVSFRCALAQQRVGIVTTLSLQPVVIITAAFPQGKATATAAAEPAPAATAAAAEGPAPMAVDGGAASGGTEGGGEEAAAAAGSQAAGEGGDGKVDGGTGSGGKADPECVKGIGDVLLGAILAPQSPARMRQVRAWGRLPKRGRRPCCVCLALLSRAPWKRGRWRRRVVAVFRRLVPRMHASGRAK